MPGTRCAVAVCKNSLKSTVQQNLFISYHSFPKETKLRTLWINACRRTDTWNPKTSVICSVHFKDDDFHLNFRRQLMDVNTKRFLKFGSAPSLLLEKEDYLLSGIHSTKSIRTYGSKNKKTVENITVSIDDSKERSNEQIIVSRAENDLILPTVDHHDIGAEDGYQQLQKRYGFLRIKYNLLKQSFNEQASKLVEWEKENSEDKIKNDYGIATDVDDFNGESTKVEPEPTEIVYLLQPDHTSSVFSNIESETLTFESENELSSHENINKENDEAAPHPNLSRGIKETCDDLKSHNEMNHKCPKSVETAHTNSSSDEKDLKCDIYTDMVAKNAGDYKCYICDRNFKRKNDMVNHMKSHARQSELKCYICNKHFKTRSYVFQHVKRHLAVKQHKCHVCSEGFQTKWELRTHKENHSAEEIHRESFKTKGDTGERIYKCNICPKGFKSKRLLVSHVKSHTGDRNRRCKFCGECFNSRDEMLQHMGREHETCDICHRGFKTKNEVVRHMKKHREAYLKCNSCGKIFFLKSSLKSHVEQNCKKLFGTIEEKLPKNANLLEDETHSALIEEDKVSIEEETLMDVTIDALEDKPSLTANESRRIIVGVKEEYPESPEIFNLWQTLNNEIIIKEEEN